MITSVDKRLTNSKRYCYATVHNLLACNTDEIQVVMLASVLASNGTKSKLNQSGSRVMRSGTGGAQADCQHNDYQIR